MMKDPFFMTVNRKKDRRRIHFPAVNSSNWSWWVIKFFLYGAMGLVLETTFTDLVRFVYNTPDIGRYVSSFTSMGFPPGFPDQMRFPAKYMYAVTSFWMIFVYGTGIYSIEFIYRLFKPVKNHPNLLYRKGLLSMTFRAFLYSLAITVTEFCWGWIYRFLLGDFLLSYRSILITTTLSILPFWFAGGYILDIIVKKTSDQALENAFCGKKRRKANAERVKLDLAEETENSD